MLQHTLALAVICLCAWAILSPRVHTGAVVTLGLGLIALGCLAVFDPGASYARALCAVLGGNLAVAGGMLWRARKARRCGAVPGSPRRRASDFGALDEARRT